MNDSQIEAGIFTCRNALESTDCEALIKYFENSCHKIASDDYNNSPGMGVRRGQVAVVYDPVLVTLLHSAALQCLHRFGSVHAGIQSLVSAGCSFTIPRIEKQTRGGGFDWHMDSRHGPGDQRFLTVLFYLSDILRGGETEFLYQKVKIRPERGKIMLCPPFWSHIHQGREPLKGIKYTAGFFVAPLANEAPPIVGHYTHSGASDRLEGPVSERTNNCP